MCIYVTWDFSGARQQFQLDALPDAINYWQQDLNLGKSSTWLLHDSFFNFSLSPLFNSHFPSGPVLACTRMSPFWILLELRVMVVETTGATTQTCKATVKMSPPTNQHPDFYRPDAIPVAHPTVLRHWREVKKLNEMKQETLIKCFCLAARRWQASARWTSTPMWLSANNCSNSPFRAAHVTSSWQKQQTNNYQQ